MFFDKFYVKLYSAIRFSYSKFLISTNMQYAGQAKTNPNGLLPVGGVLDWNHSFAGLPRE